MSITTTDRRPEIGALLRKLREQAGVSRSEAAAILGCTSSKIGDLELARSNPKPAEVEKLLVRYVVPADKRAWILSHVRQQASRKPRGTYSDFAPPPRLRRIAELETQAVVACYYSSEVIPPPLQTPAYSEELIAAVEPDVATVKNLATFQLTRQQAIDTHYSETPLKYRCFLGEAAFHTNVGNEATMVDQVAHLRSLAARLPNLSTPFES